MGRRNVRPTGPVADHRHSHRLVHKPQAGRRAPEQPVVDRGRLSLRRLDSLRA